MKSDEKGTGWARNKLPNSVEFRMNSIGLNEIKFKLKTMHCNAFCNLYAFVILKKLRKLKTWNLPIGAL